MRRGGVLALLIACWATRLSAQSAPPTPTTAPESPALNRLPPSAPTSSPGSESTPAPAAVAPAATASSPAAAEETPLSHLRVAAWVGVAGSVALLTAGGIFGLAAQARADEISRRLTFVDPSSGQPRRFDAAAQTDYRSLRDEGRLYNALSIGFFAAAGAAAATTVTLFVLDRRHGGAKHALRVAPTLGASLIGAAADWSF